MQQPESLGLLVADGREFRRRRDASPAPPVAQPVDVARATRLDMIERGIQGGGAHCLALVLIGVGVGLGLILAPFLAPSPAVTCVCN